MGVGVFAGEPWHYSAQRFPNSTVMPIGSPGTCSNQTCDGCPEGETVFCDQCKNHPQFTDVKVLAESARRMAADGLIDDVAHLVRTRAYTYCGTQDQGHFAATVAARDFYAQFNSSIKYNFSIPSGHCWPVDSGTPVLCGGGKFLPKVMSAFPLQNCGYDGPRELLEHVYGELKPQVAMKEANLHLFNQEPYNRSPWVQLGSVGYIYVPNSCADGKTVCRLHVSLHGCQNPMILEAPEVRRLSFNRWAETNGIVVLWPHKDNNQSGCWDSYDKTPDFDNQRGPQMIAIADMVQAISGVKMGRH